VRVAHGTVPRYLGTESREQEIRRGAFVTQGIAERVTLEYDPRPLVGDLLSPPLLRDSRYGGAEVVEGRCHFDMQGTAHILRR